MDNLEQQQEEELNNQSEKNEFEPLSSAPFAPEQPFKLDRNRKIAVGVLAVFTIFIFFAWIGQLRNSISQPFYKSNSTNQNGENGTSYEAEDSAASLRAKDTDGDGLNDYDELNSYNTSPYLEDSDSDGFSDNEEIVSGNNPSCPVGSECQVEEALVESQTNSSNIPGGDTEAQLQKVQADALREIMLETGFDKDKLDLISDADLIRLYQENAAKTDETETKKNDAKTIRQEMIAAGFDKAKLDLVSDADLIKAYEESLAAYNKSAN